MTNYHSGLQTDHNVKEDNIEDEQRSQIQWADGDVDTTMAKLNEEVDGKTDSKDDGNGRWHFFSIHSFYCLCVFYLLTYLSSSQLLLRPSILRLLHDMILRIGFNSKGSEDIAVMYPRGLVLVLEVLWGQRAVSLSSSSDSHPCPRPRVPSPSWP